MSRRVVLLGALAVGLVAVGAGVALWATSSDGSTEPLSSLGPLEPAPPPGRLGAELVPVPDAPPLAPAGSTARLDKSVGGIKCEFNVKLVLHHHSYLTLFVNGKPRRLPAGVGIWPPLGPENYRNGQFGAAPGTCISWVSTRYPDGLIHVEAPMQRSFVLGEFFDIWGQPLSRSQVGPARGEVTAIVNEHVWTGDPREIPLEAHSQIQLQVGRPLVAPRPIEFPGSF